MGNSELMTVEEDNIRNRIYTARDKQVMLDEDLAICYGVPTKRLNEQVKRNYERFPDEFCFQLTRIEYTNLMSQIATSSLRSQFATSKGHGGRRKLPYAFTEQGVAMLAGVLKSEVAISMSIRIINEFVVMRHILRANDYLLQRVETVEKRQITHEVKTEQKFERIFNALADTDGIPKQQLFFDGQFFDAYAFVTKIIRSAKKKIILIDNFINETTLELLSKRRNSVEIAIYTKNISSLLERDVTKFNAQYPTLIVKELKTAHDRFLIIDDKLIYHFGASLKDLGKKWFACTKLKIDAKLILEKL